MAELTVPRVDFSSLGDLPDVYRNARTQATREMTLANLAQGGNVNYEQAAASLLRGGDLAGGMQLAQLGKALRPEQTKEIRNYLFGQQNPGFADYQRKVGSDGYGLNPIYGTDTQGNPVLLQVGKDGRAVQTQIPQGVSISTGIEKLDLGDRWGLRDKRSGQVVGYEPKNLARAAADKVVGEASGKAEVALPQVIAKTDNMVRTIDGILNDPGLEKATGMLSLMQRVPNTDAYRFGTRVRQLQGQAFLQAFESLKGGGQITEIEGQKATDAIGRLDSAQRPEDYRNAMNELREIILLARERAKQGITVRSNVTGQRSGPVPSTNRVWGDAEAESAGLYEPRPSGNRLRFNPSTGNLE
jgi:hypothetical protein